MATLRFLLNDAAGKFETAGIDNARGEAEQLLCRAFNTDRLHLQLALDSEAGYGMPVAMFEIYCESRLEGRPLQYVLGSAQFLDFELEVNENVLIPRPETEELAVLAADFIKERIGRGENVKALDLCTGSGCLALNSAESGAETTATDISPDALAVARRNAEKCFLDLDFREGDLWDAVPADARFDLITANPPYIPSAVCEELQPEVRDFEPRLALDGGEDGLDLVRRIIEGLPDHLAEGGLLLMEIGDDQGAAALKLCPGGEIIQDLGGLDRILKFLKK